MTQGHSNVKRGKIIHIDKKQVRGHLGEIVRGTGQETLNTLLDEKADRLCNEKRMSEQRSGKIRDQVSTQGEVKVSSGDARGDPCLGRQRGSSAEGSDRNKKASEHEAGPGGRYREEGIAETVSYYAFFGEHWRRIRTNNPLERIIKEIRRRTRVVGSFPDGNSAVMLVAARLRHIAGTKWGWKQYLKMDRLEEDLKEIAA